MESEIQAAHPLPVSFYLQPTPVVAPRLLGKLLCHRTPEGMAAGIIVETEAYLSGEDPASHSLLRKGEQWRPKITDRNWPMFGPPGRAYVYFVYGRNWCFNIVTGPDGVGEAVLVRALEPAAGIELMKSRRGTDNLRLLASGPGRLTQAMGIGAEQNGADLTTGDLTVAEGEQIPEQRVVQTTRVGIKLAADLPLRFYLKDSPFVSRR